MKKLFKKLLLPIGPIILIILIGILLLSSLLYYRSIKVQRFLEPALALSEPRLRFSQNINNIVLKEFDSEEINKLKVKSSSLIVDRSLLFSDEGTIKTQTIKKLSSVFLKALSDQDIRKYISLILIGIRLPTNSKDESDTYNIAKNIMDLLFKYEPALKKEYGNYFSPSIMWSDRKKENITSIEFKIVPSEQLHIDVLQKLIKYAE
jgi:hypothetical protein